jgi:hypothetical protein
MDAPVSGTLSERCSPMSRRGPLAAAGIVLGLAAVLALPGCSRHAGPAGPSVPKSPPGTHVAAASRRQAKPSIAIVQYGRGVVYQSIQPGVLKVLGPLPPESWALSGTKDARLVADIVAAARSPRNLSPPIGLADTELLYVRDEKGRATTASLTVYRDRKTVFLGHGTRESRRLYALLREAERQSGGARARPWPKDVLTVPHNKW